MAPPAMGHSAIEDRISLVEERLVASHREIAQAILSRFSSLFDQSADIDPGYAEGLRAAVTAAVTYGVGNLKLSEAEPPPIPTPLYAQAREAARHGVSLDTVLRRYVAGYTLLGEFLMRESEEAGLRSEEVHRLLRVQAARFDQIVAKVTDEYRRESEGFRSSGEAQMARIRGLLAGRPVDPAALGYEIADWHLAAIGSGPGVPAAFQGLAKALDRRLLLADAGEGRTWAWLGGRRRTDPAELVSRGADFLGSAALAVGEPGRGLSGWRLTHLQAKTALAVATREPGRPVRYRDVALLVPALRDEVLSASLRQLYLEPLEGGRDNGETLRETLHAYFVAESNLSAAAAALGVTRHTVKNRLHAIEERLGRPLGECGLDLEMALRLREMGD